MASGERIRAEPRDGARFLWCQHFPRTMALLLMVTNIVVAGALLTVVVAGREQGLSGGEIGAIIAALGVASLVGSFAAPVIRRSLPGPRIMLLELWTSVGTGAFALWPDVYVLAAAILPLAGLALLVAIVGTLSPSMRTAPDLDRLDAVTASR